MRSLPPVTVIDKKYERICVMKKKLTTEEKSSVQEAIAGQKKKKKMRENILVNLNKH